MPPHGCVAPAESVVLMAECVLAPAETARIREDNLCSKGKRASFR